MPSDAPEQSIGFLISDVSRLLRRIYDQRVEPLGLTRSQWRVLVHLHRHEGVNQAELATILEIQKQTLGRLIDKLEKEGWIERRADDKDARSKRLFISDKVRPLIKELRARANTVTRDALSGFRDQEAQQLTQFLLDVKSNLQTHLSNGTDDSEK